VGIFDMANNKLNEKTAENILLSLINDQGIFANPIDAIGFEGIVFDTRNRFFKLGKSPFYLSIKCIASSTDDYGMEVMNRLSMQKITSLADTLRIDPESLYFAVGFYRGANIRDIVYYVIPFSALGYFESGDEYRFSVKACDDAREKDANIIKL